MLCQVLKEAHEIQQLSREILLKSIQRFNRELFRVQHIIIKYSVWIRINHSDTMGQIEFNLASQIVSTLKHF